MRLHVVGDSVPAGYGLDNPGDTAWPARLVEFVPELTAADLTVDASTGRTLRECADRLTADALAEQFDSGDDGADTGADAAGTGRRVVLVHAGHNDAQLSGGEPRVSEADFRETAAELDARLADSDRVDRHAVVGMVPLLPLDRPGTIPVGDEHPARALAYDDLLAETVGAHLRVVSDDEADAGRGDRPGDGTGSLTSTLADWREWTADGVHPGPAGHEFLARTVAEWLVD
jgi:lysophospholipase L1-like esterase